MSKTSAEVKNRYNQKVYDRINYVVKKGEKEQIKPVSYTHLDVYKRQNLILPEFYLDASTGHLMCKQGKTVTVKVENNHVLVEVA